MFCTRVIVLDGGRLLFDGPTADGINFYLQLISDEARSSVGHGDGGILLTGARCRQSDGEESWRAHPGASIVLEFDYQVAGSVDAGFVRLPIVSATDGTVIATIEEPLSSRGFVPGATGTVKVELRNVPLRQGEFKVEPEILDRARRVASRMKPSIQLPFLRVEPRSKDRYERIGLVELPSKISSNLYPSGQG